MAAQGSPAYESREQLLMRVLEQNKQMKAISYFYKSFRNLAMIVQQETIIEENREKIASLSRELESCKSSQARNSILDYSTSVFGDENVDENPSQPKVAHDPYAYDPWAEDAEELAPQPVKRSTKAGSDSVVSRPKDIKPASKVNDVAVQEVLLLNKENTDLKTQLRFLEACNRKSGELEALATKRHESLQELQEENIKLKNLVSAASAVHSDASLSPAL